GNVVTGMKSDQVTLFPKPHPRLARLDSPSPAWRGGWEVRFEGTFHHILHRLWYVMERPSFALLLRWPLSGQSNRLCFASQERQALRRQVPSGVTAGTPQARRRCQIRVDGGKGFQHHRAGKLNRL